MRGSLNLGRLQSRGQAAETVYFAKQQKEAARNLRSKLTSTELSSLRSASKASSTIPTVDTLTEISAHYTYDHIIHHAASSEPLIYRSGILRSWKDPKELSPLPRKDGKEQMLDPDLMRALGQSRYAVAREYMEKIEQSGVAVSKGRGSYEEGAMLGVGAFGIATGIVMSIGAVGLGYLYLHPNVVEGFKTRSITLRRKLDRSLGVRLREFSESMKRRGALVSPEAAESARGIARSSIGMQTPEKP